MPVSAVRTVEDWLQGSLRGAAHPNADGSLTLAPKDFIRGFSAPETDGIPSGWSMTLPSDITGHAIFAGTVEGNQETATRQNTTPFSLEASHWRAAQPIIRGQKPMPKLYQVSLPQPPKPIVESVPTDEAGFPAGTVKVAYTEIAGGGLETQLSGYSEITVSQGNAINLTLPGELSADRVGIGIYVSYAGVGAFRKVRNLSSGFLDSGAKSYTMTEYRRGAKPPSENRTMLGRGKKPGRLRFQRGRYALAPRVYRHTYTRVTRFGESLAAPFSERRNIIERHPGRALWIPPIPRTRGSVGVQVYVEMDDEVYKVVDRASELPYISYATLISRGVDIYGVSADDSMGGRQGTWARPNLNPRYLLVQQDLPEEDTSGLEGPGSDAELELTTKGSTLPEPGRRFYQTAYLSDEGQGPTSPYTRHNTPAGSMPRITLSHPVNILKNAEVSELRQSGTPLSWHLRGSGTADSYAVSDGILSLFTTTATSTTRYWESARFPVNSLADTTVRGVVEASIVSGSAQLVLFSYDSSGAKLNETIVGELTSSGRVPLTRIFGPSGTAIPANAAEGSYVIRMAGSTRNMRIDTSHRAVHPFKGTPRKVSNLYVDGEEADYNPTPEVSFHTNGHTGFGLPPAVPEQAGSEDTAIRTGFEEQAYASSDGAAWTRVVSQNAANVIESAAAITGSYGLRVSKPGGVAGNASYIAKPITGTECARRQKVYVVREVGGTGNFVTLSRFIRSDTAGVFAQLELYSTGRLQIRYDDRNSNTTTANVIGVFEGDMVDMEVVISGADSSSGAITVLAGKNTNTRSIAYSATGIDWRGVRPSEYRAGVSSVSNELAGWSFYIDDIAETEKGDSLTDASAAPPEGMAPEPPDRPQNSDGSYRDTDVNGDTIRQFYAFVLAGEERYAPTSERYAVLPEETYYPAIFARSDSGACEPWRVVCYTADGEPTDMGSIWSAGPSQPWADRPLEVVIPPDCVELQFVGQRLAPGEYCAQEPALSWREANADRSAGYVEDTGGFTATLPYNPEDTHYNPSDGDGWRELGLAHEANDGEVRAYFRSGSDLLTWSEYVSDAEQAPEDAHAQIDGEMSVSGGESPLVPSGGAYLSYDLTRPTLLMPDGSPLPGGAVVGGLREAFERADYEVESVGGRTIATPTTPRVLRLAGVEVSVFTPQARRLVEDYCLEWEWLMELPLAGGTPSGGRGYLFTVRFPEVIEMEDFEPPFTRADHTFVHSTAEVEGPIDCLEISEL